jgi:peptide/nickel transport system substrate-binding protein
LTTRSLTQRIAAALTLSAVLVIAGCGKSPTPPSLQQNAPTSQSGGGSQVTVVLDGDPPSLNPNFNGAAVTTTLTSNIFDPLFLRNAKGDIEPGLAASWENPKPDTWVINLRKDVTFHNGDKLTAADVVFSIDRILNEKNASTQRGTYSFISKATAIDDTKVEIVTKGAYPPFLSRMVDLLIVPKAYLEKVGVEAFGRQPVGTGPYKFTSWKAGQDVTLEAYDQYWRGKAAVAKVVWRVIPEGTTQIQELRSGGVDLVAGVQPDQIPSLKKDAGITIKTTPTTRTMMLPIDPTNKPLNDVKVRQALNYAVDKNAIITNILNGLGTPLKGVLPDMVFGHNPDLSPYPYDPAKAKQLLAEAGYPNGFTVDFKATASKVPNAKQIAEAVRGYWDDIGVKTNFNFYQEIAPWLAQWPDKVKPLPMSSWGGGFDADFYYFPIVRKGNPYAVFTDPKVDAMIDNARTTIDQKERLAIYHDAEKYMVENAGWVFLWSQQAAFGMSNRLDWAPRVDEGIQAYEFKLKQ